MLPTSLVSPLESVSNDAWSAFVNAMITAPTSAVSGSNALGAFEMMPRRLVDLGYLKGELERTRSKKSGRTIWAATNSDDHTRATKFLKNLSLQYQAFMSSMKDYASKFSTGAVKLPADCTLSGALAVCHRAGVSGLSGSRFPATQIAHSKANGIF